MSTETLTCAEGRHTWERERTRGRKPAYCPAHAPIPFVVRSSAVATDENGANVVYTPRNRPVIEQALATRSQSCRCDIRPDMSNAELMHVKSCKVAFVCPVIDSLRRRLVA